MKGERREKGGRRKGGEREERGKGERREKEGREKGKGREGRGKREGRERVCDYINTINIISSFIPRPAFVKLQVCK